MGSAAIRNHRMAFGALVLALSLPISQAFSFSAPAMGVLRHGVLSHAVSAPTRPAQWRPSAVLRMQEEAAPETPACIQFIQGVNEDEVPDVRLTRAVDGSTGNAYFSFQNPSFFDARSQSQGEVTGMYM